MVEQVGNLPGLRHWRMARFGQAFQSGRAVGCFRGVYASHAQAAAAAPPNQPFGYDHAEGGQMYRDRLTSLYPGDYPMLVWLGKALSEGARDLFDLGGHIGLSYYTYQRALDFPSELRWRVHDVPSVMAAGRAEAAFRDPSGRLRFEDDFASAAQADVLFTAGCLQYLESTLAEKIGGLRRRPPWVLVNLLPLHPDEAYWTVQSIGTAFCPYRIQRDNHFFADLAKLGYRVQDRWENLEKGCWIAFDPRHSLDRYHGAAFRLEG
jgi:putative methyltransferase (TIGR04325 family)